MKTVIVKGSGGAGLGDRLGGLVGALAVARLTGRSLYVDWRDTAYGDGSRNYFSDLFCVTGLTCLPDLPQEGSVIPETWAGRLHFSLNEIVEADDMEWSRDKGRLRYNVDYSRLDHPADHLVMFELDFFERIQPAIAAAIPEYATLSADQIRSRLVEKHLVLRPEILAHAQRFRDQHFESGKMIGVHVRKTRECDLSRPNPELGSFLRKAAEFLSSTKGAMLFLSTDNSAVIEMFYHRFGKERVLTMAKWMPDAGLHLHMNSECPDQLASARDALAEVWLLAQCDWLITSGCSGFSWMARMFSRAAPYRQVVLHPPVPLRWRLRNLAVAWLPVCGLRAFRKFFRRTRGKLS